VEVGRRSRRYAVPLNIIDMSPEVQDELLHQECHEPNICNLVNLTPHEVTLVGEDGGIILRIPPSGIVARCREEVNPAGEIAVCPGGPLTPEVAVPLVKRAWGPIDGLPAPQFRTVFITSSLVAQAAWAQGRRDVVAPGELVRDSEGRVIGCKNLSTAP
jgi:hypothetical protein